MREIVYSKIAIVLETLDAARYHVKDFENKFGHKAVQSGFLHLMLSTRMFVLEPHTKLVFGFDQGHAMGQAYVDVHTTTFPGFMDSFIQMLGPDVEFIEDIFEQVGKQHKATNVKPSFFAFMGKALILTVEEYLKRPLTTAKQDAWKEVYDEISMVMIKNILSWKKVARRWCCQMRRQVGTMQLNN